MTKQYIGLVKDHSGSMFGIRHAAARDYNSLIDSIQKAAIKNNIDTIVSVVKCGIGPGIGRVEREIVNSNVHVLKPIRESEYVANGNSTPLFDSVGELIDLFKAVPDYNHPDVSFLLMIVTDGQENSSRNWLTKIKEEIKVLQNSDRWTFVFRVPKGQYNPLEKYGIPAGNILEWETTAEGLCTSTIVTTSSVDAFYQMRSKGGTATKSFFTTNLNMASRADIKANLDPITKEASIYLNSVKDGISIKELSEYYTGHFIKGTVFFQLMKHESHVQEYKIICIRDKTNKAIYSGIAARDLLGLPHYGMISLSPGNHGNFDIFIQSTSLNRKIPLNTSILIWRTVRRI